MQATVRPWQEDDIPNIVRYWTTLSEADADRMGADRSRIPSAAEYARLLHQQLHAPATSAVAFYSMWLVDRKAIGFSSLKNIQFGKRGEMHLHIWDQVNRGKGIGSTLFCLSALDCYKRFELQEIVCEPSAKNPMPNRMLQKVGFPLLSSRIGRGSDIAAEQEMNTYGISADVAIAYVAGTRLEPSNEGD
jgi:RimJ/RimL family protein N-acetyltransferase